METENRTEKVLAREWSPVGLALSCVLAAIGLCLRSDNQLLLLYASRGASEVFVASFLLGVVALCAAVLVSAHDEERRRWSIGIGLVTGIAGVTFGLFAQALPAAMSAAGAGALLGFGLTCLLRQWVRYYRLLSFQGALLNTALAFLAASLLRVAVACANTPFLFGLGMLVLVSCGGLPLLAHQIVQAGEAAPRLSPSAVELGKSLVTMRQVMRMGWAAVAGLLLNFFLMGLTFWSEVEIAGEAGGFAPKLAAYAVLVVAAVLVVSRARTPVGGALELFYRASLLVAALIMLARLLVEPMASLPGSMAFSFALHLGIALCNVLGLVILLWTEKCSEVGFSKVLAAFCASCVAAVAAGMLVFQLLGEGARTVLLCLVAVYLVAMVLDEVRAGFDRKLAGRKDGAVGEAVCEGQEELLDLDR